MIEQLFEIPRKTDDDATHQGGRLRRLAEIPGVRLLPGITDALGPCGDAVTLVSEGGRRLDRGSSK